MIFKFSFAIGILMFIHYGWSILRHDVSQSTKLLIVNLYVIMTCAVLILRASFIKDADDLLCAFMVAVASQTVVHIYFWFYGLSFKNAAKRVNEIQIPFKDYLKQIKKCL
jgi:hypothetical protein